MKIIFTLILSAYWSLIYGQDRIIFKSALDYKDVKIEKIDTNFIYIEELNQKKIYNKVELVAYIYNYRNNKSEFILANKADSSRYLISKYGKVRDLVLERSQEELFKKFEFKEYKELSSSKRLGFKKLSNTLYIENNQKIYISIYIDLYNRILAGKYTTCDDSVLIMKAKVHKIRRYYRIPLNQINLYGVETPGLVALRVGYIATFWWTIGFGNISIIRSFTHPFYKRINNGKWQRIK